jgi:hypothetical protein
MPSPFDIFKTLKTIISSCIIEPPLGLSKVSLISGKTLEDTTTELNKS